MTYVTPEQYYAGYENDPDANDERRAATAEFLPRLNGLMGEAEADGLVFHVNPATGCYISGNGHGAFRNQACTIGAPKSTHKRGVACDIYDPHRDFARWCWNHRDRLAAYGLHMEDPHWTSTWCHLQGVPPGNPPVPSKIVFIPSNDPPAYRGEV